METEVILTNVYKLIDMKWRIFRRGSHTHPILFGVNILYNTDFNALLKSIDTQILYEYYL